MQKTYVPTECASYIILLTSNQSSTIIVNYKKTLRKNLEHELLDVQKNVKEFHWNNLSKFSSSNRKKIY